MVVEVLQRKRQRRLGARFSLLGDSLLERTRSTTFALLGLTAAVGLAVVAVALQGGWPLVPGSPVPRAPVVHQSVGAATALAAPRAVVQSPSPRAKRGAAPRPRKSSHPANEPVAAPPATPALTELVSSPAAPVGQRGGHGNGSPAPQAPAPTAPQPQTPGAAAPTIPTKPTASPAPKPPPSPPQPAPPEAVASEAPPPASNVPPWSNGQGHAYGRGGDEEHGCGHGHDD